VCPFSKPPIIVALDLPERAALVAMAKRLAPHVAMAKIGLEAFVGHGPDLVREIRDTGLPIFLDLKLHDIQNTVAAATAQATRLGVTLLTGHAQGGAEMIRAAREAASESVQIVAVTVLTSLDALALEQLGYQDAVCDVAERLGSVARLAGADGLVCAASDLKRLQHLGGVRVVPGLRPAGSAAGDQKRVATPKAALSAGATWLVIGRPIVQAGDPVAAAQAIAEELAAGSGAA
jgi:orotidine-5'-phosphate decarboxylase